MKILISHLLLLFLTNYGLCQQKHLEFLDKKNYVNFHVLSYTTKVHAYVNASNTEESVVVVHWSGIAHKMEFDCRVKKLAQGYYATVAQFCYRLEGDKAECVSANKASATGAFQNSLSFNYAFKKETGLMIIVPLQMKKGTTDRSGKYYCELRNSMETIRSNDVEIVDGVYYESNILNPLGREIELTTPPIKSDDLPKKFACGRTKSMIIPDKYRFYIATRVKWSYCNLDQLASKTLSFCSEQYKRADSKIAHTTFGQGVVLPDSSLVYTSMSKPSFQAALFCIIDGSVVSFYWGPQLNTPLSYELGNTATPSFKTIDDEFRTVMLRRGSILDFAPNDEKEQRPLLKFNYVSNDKSSAFWTFNDVKILPHGITDTSDELRLSGEATDALSGTYKLFVSGIQRFTVQITVYGPPLLKSTLPDYKYVMVGESVSFTAEYDETTNEKKIEINGVPSNSKAKPQYLRDLKYVIKPNPIKISDPVTYTANNLTMDATTGETQSHVVTFIGSNDYGRVSTNVKIRVLKKPKVTKRPESCLKNCMNYDMHMFDCEVEETDYKLVGAIVYYFWTVGDVDVNVAFRNLFEILPNNSLVLNKVFREKGSTEERALNVLKNNSLSCRVRLFHPKILEKPKHEWKVDTQYLVFDSKSDAALHKSLTAGVMLTEDATVSPINASLGWIAGVVVAIVIILIIIALTVYMLMRSKGETYLVDQKERAQGNDPEKEIRETEVFHNYERPEEAPVRGSRFSLNDESVGVGSESEGELEEYDLDPGNFNEEGSFIGQYANDRKKVLPSANTSASAGLLKNDTQV